MLKVKCSEKFSNNSEVGDIPSTSSKSLQFQTQENVFAGPWLPNGLFTQVFIVTMGPRAMFVSWLVGQLEP